MSIKTKAVKYAIRLARKRKGLKVKELKTATLDNYIRQAGQKRKLTETERAANKLRTAYQFKKKLPKTQIIINRIKAQKQKYESYKKIGPRIQAKTDIKYKFKQKPKTGGGSERNPTQLTYGPGGTEMKVGSRMARRAIWHDTRGKGSESWRDELTRYFGGIHMSQTKEGAKKSVNILAKEYKKRFKKKKVVKAAEGGYLAGGLLGQGIRLIYKDPASKAALKKLTHWVKSKYKGKTFGTLGKLELKHRKAEGLVKYSKLIQGKIAKDPSRFKSLKNAEKAKNVFKKTQLQAESYKKKINLITKTLMNRKSNVTLHSEGGEVTISKNVDRSLL